MSTIKHEHAIRTNRYCKYLLMVMRLSSTYLYLVSATLYRGMEIYRVMQKHFFENKKIQIE